MPDLHKRRGGICDKLSVTWVDTINPNGKRSRSTEKGAPRLESEKPLRTGSFVGFVRTDNEIFAGTCSGN